MDEGSHLAVGAHAGRSPNDKLEVEPALAEARERHNRPLELQPSEPGPCPAGADAVERMRHRMGTSVGKAVCARRKATVETVFGAVKEALGFRQFSMRGHAAAGFEWRLACAAWNLKRMHVAPGKALARGRLEKGGATRN